MLICFLVNITQTLILALGSVKSNLNLQHFLDFDTFLLHFSRMRQSHPERNNYFLYLYFVLNL